MTRKFKNVLLLLIISLFLMLLGTRFGWLFAIGFFLMIIDFIYALLGSSNNHSKNESTTGFHDVSSTKTIKLNRDTLFKKLPQEIRFLQKFKDFYSNKVNSLPKRFFFWIFTIIFFIFILPFCLGAALASYIFPRIETKPSWLKLGIVALILIVTFQVGIGWTKNLLGMNTPPNIAISNPITKEIKVKGVSAIEISGKINPAGSTIEINNSIVKVTDNGDFTKKVSISKGKNEINIIGKHGSGITEKTIMVYRELTEEEIAEEKIRQEERKARAEEERIAREEAEESKKKARAEARRKAAEVAEEAEAEAVAKEEKKIQELADIFCLNRSRTNVHYANLDDIATWLEAGQAMEIRSVYNQAPSKASCRRVAEQCLEGLAGWSEADCKKIAEKKIWLGMTLHQLILSWGWPQDKNDTVGIWGINTQWVYGDFGPYVYLEGDSREDLIVTSWQN